MSTSLAPSDLETPPIWVLSVTYAGQRFLWSSEPVAVTDADGNTLSCDGMLDPVELDYTFGAPGDEPDADTVAFRELSFPVDLALYEARGHRLDGSEAEVSILPSGGAWEDRRVVLLGSVSDAIYGDADEPVSFSVDANPWEDAALYPPSTWVISETTFPPGAGEELPAASVGQEYPTLFGSPGWYIRSPSTSTQGAPAIPVVYNTASSENRKLLVAGHRMMTTSVALFYDGTETTETIEHEEDGLGQTVAVINLTAASAEAGASSYWVAINNANGSLQRHDAATAITRAGQLALWALRQTTLKVDDGAWAAVAPWLDRYQVSTYIDATVSPWQWFTENLLPILPIDVRTGPQGLYPVLWRYDAIETDGVTLLTEGVDVVRVSRASTMQVDQIINEVRLSHSVDAGTNQYKRVTVVRGDADTSAGEFPSYPAEVSRRRYGTRARAMSSDLIYDVNTAVLVASWLISAFALPSREIEYEAGSEWAWLPLGAPVKLTDAGLHYTNQVVLVAGITWVTEATIRLRLLWLESMQRDTRPTP